MITKWVGAALVAASIILAAALSISYFLGENRVDEIRARAVADSTRAEALVSALLKRDSVLMDSLVRIKAKTDTIERVRVIRVKQSFETGATLEKHLDIRADRAGQRLLAVHLLADSTLVGTHALEVASYIEREQLFEARLLVKDSLLLVRDDEMIGLRANLDDALAEASRGFLDLDLSLGGIVLPALGCTAAGAVAGAVSGDRGFDTGSALFVGGSCVGTVIGIKLAF